MQRTLITLSAAAAAAMLGWLARGIEIETPAAPAPVVVHAEVAQETAPAPARVAGFELPRTSAGKRNLFAYREAAPRPVVTYTPPPAIVAAPAPLPAIEAPPEPRPQFAYRFIGTFGTRDTRFAAFSRDGEVITVRPGRKIGTDFVLRSIGVESVEVENTRGATMRVALGD